MYTEGETYATISKIRKTKEKTHTMSKRKNFWILLLLLLAGIVLGGFIGTMASDISWPAWLNFGESFGLDSPVVLDFGILVITFGLTIKITMASIIGVIIAIITYRMI